MKAEDKNWVTIAKYLKGELSDQERHEFSDWVHASPENKEILDQAKNLWITVDQEPEFEVDVDKNWESFASKVGINTENEGPEVQKKSKQLLWPWVFRAAAAVLVVLLISYLAIRPGQEEQLLSFESPHNEIRELYLPDSSKVFLNKGSRLSYAQGFNLDNRVVNLEGEAFFEVKRAEGYRFIVFAKNAKTEVLGTSFTVTAYDSLPGVEVKVATGRVAFSLQDESNTIFLEPGSKGVMNEATSEVSKGEIEHENFLSWKTNSLVYNNTRFSKVIHSLEDHFGTTIDVQSPELYNCNYSGTFDGPDLESVLEVLSATMNFNFSRNNGGYTVNGPGCK